MSLYPIIDWVQQSPLFNTDRDDVLDNTSHKCASDASGNFYFVYRTNAGGIVSGQISPGDINGRDLVLVKLGPSGNLLYVKQTAISGAANESNPSLAIDVSGNIYITCATSGTLSGQTKVSNAGTNELAIIKLDTDGNVLWIKQDNTISPSSSASTDQHSIVVDNGFIYIAAQTYGAASGGTAQIGSADIVIMKLDATTGVRQWISSGNIISTAGLEEFPNIAVVNQSIYLLYRTPNTSSVVGGAAPVGGVDLILSKFSTVDGSRIWIQSGNLISTTGGENDISLATDANENVYITYSASATISGGTAQGGTDVIVVKLDSNGNRLWAHQNATTSTSGTDGFGPRIAVDYDGDVYITYITNNNISGDAGDFDPLTGKFIGAAHRGGNDVVVAKLSGSTGTRIWAAQKSLVNTTTTETYPFLSIVPGTKQLRVLYQTSGAVTGGTNLQKPVPDTILCQFDSTGTLEANFSRAVYNTSGTESSICTRVDTAGNVYVAYITTGGAVSGGGTTSNSDVVIAKFNSSRVLQWARQSNTISTPQTETGLTIAVDSAQNVFVAFASTGTSSGGVANLGGGDIILVKLNSSGNRTWTLSAAQNAAINTSVAQDRPQLETDGSGNVYMAYRSAGAVSGGTATGSNDIVVMKLDTNGNRLWATQNNTINTAGSDGDNGKGPRLAVSSSGEVYVTYQVNPNNTVSGGTIVSTTQTSIVLVKLNSSGVREWFVHDGNINSASGFLTTNPTLCLDPSGNVYIVVQTANNVSGATTSAGSFARADIAIVKYNSAGVKQWVLQNAQMNTALLEQTPEVTSDKAGAVYLAYTTTGTTSGNTRPDSQDYLTNASNDIVLTKVSWDGALQWVKQGPSWNTYDNDNGPSLVTSNDATDANVKVYLAFQGLPADGSTPTLTNSTDMAVFQMTEQTLPTQPYNLTASAASSSSVTLTWTIDSLGTAPLTDYYMDIERKYASKGSQPIPSVRIPIENVTSLGSNQYSTTIALSGDGEYTVDIWASNGSAPGPSSAAITFLTNTAEPSAPQNLAASGKDQTLFLTWDHPATGVATSYTVTLSDGTIRTVTSPFTSFTGLTNGVLYTATVSSANSLYAAGTAATVSYTITATPIAMPTLEWIKQDATINTTVSDQIISGSSGSVSQIGCDASGNVYITTTTAGVLSGIGAGGFDVTLAKISPTGERVWAIQRVISTAASDDGGALAVDASNNVILVYRAQNPGVVSGGTLTGGNDIVVIKLDSDGNILWTKQDNTINSTAAEDTPHITTDHENNIYITYATNGTVSGGMANRGNNDSVIVKLDSNGNRIFMKQDYELNDSGFQSTAAICVDKSLNMYLLLRSSTAVSGGTAIVGSDDVILLKYNQYGVRQWVVPNVLTSSNLQEFGRNSIRVDKGGNIYIAYSNTGGGIISGGSILGNSINVTLQKFDTNGNRLWINNSNLINTTASSQHQQIDIDEDGNIYLVYNTPGTVSGLGPPSGGINVIVSKFDTYGNRVWGFNSSALNTAVDETATCIVVYSPTQIYIAYQSLGATSGQTYLGSNDVVVARLGQLFAPTEPTSLVATPADGSVSIAFTAPASDGGSAITNYKYSINGGTTFTAFSPAITSGPATITGLTNGTTYSIQLEAVNAVGDGLNSATVTATPRTVPDAPTSLVATPSDSAVSIAFTAPASDGGSAITNYKYSIDGGATFTDFSPAQTSSPVTITALTNGTAYDIQLRAVNAAGDSSASSQVTATPVTTPSAPTSLVATPADGEISISFTAPNDGGSPITNYEYSIDDGAIYVFFSPAQTSSPITISNLTNGQSYIIKLKAVNAVGSGPASTAVTSTPRTTPTAPQNLEATVGDGSVTIAFTGPASNGGATITNYKYSIDGGSTFTAFSPAQSSSPVTISGLTNGQSYTIRLKAVNVAGEGLTSAQITATPITVPSAPTSLVATPSDGSVSVAFTTPTSDGASPITNYKVSTDGGASFTALSPAQTTSPITLSSLTNGRTYQIQLKAVNAAGDSAASSQVSVMPVASAEPEPTTVQGLLDYPEDLKTYLTSFTTPPVPVLTIEAAPVTNIIVNPAPGFDTTSTYTIRFVLPENGVGQEITTDNFSNGDIIYIPTTHGEVFSLTVDSLLYVIITSDFSIAINSVSYNLGNTVVLGNRTFIVAFTGSVGLLAQSSGTPTVPCIVEGQNVLTPDGYRKIETLNHGDLIVTAEGSAVPVKIYKTVIKHTTKENAPIKIDINGKSIQVSPHHAYKINSSGWMFPSVALNAEFPGVTQMPLGERVVYYHLETPNYLRDDIVLEGAVVESLGTNYVKTNNIRICELYVKSKQGEWYERMKRLPRKKTLTR